MRKILLIFLFVFFFALPVFAQQVDTVWVRRYNGQGNGNDVACAIVVDASGNVYVTGTSYDSVTSNDYATIKYNSNGDTAWVRRYNGPGNSSDVARSMALDPSGYIYITGTSGTVKYDAQGNQLWVDTLAGVDIALDGLGNVYTTGIHWDGTQSNCITVKYNSNGSIAWADTLVNYSTRALTADGSGNIYVTGNSYGGASGSDFATIKYYPNGDTAWVRTYDGPSHTTDGAVDIGVDELGNVYVTGTSEESKYGAGPDDDITTIKYDTDGNEEWVRRYNRAGRDDHGKALAIDHSGNAWVAGDIAFKFWADVVTLWFGQKYDPDGNTIGGFGLGGALPQSQSEPTAICIDPFNNAYVTGWIDTVGRRWDYATIMRSAEGNRYWVSVFRDLDNHYDQARAIAVDGIGNVYVTGAMGGSSHNSSDFDYGTIKYWQNYPPDSFSLVSPSDSAVLSYTVTLNWQTATDPDPWDTTRYDLYVSTSPNFHPDSTVIFNHLLLNQQTDTLEIGKYYWKVRAYDKRLETWSNQIWTFRVQNYPPNVFSLLSPSDSAMIPYIVAFDWETATDPDPWDTAKYDLYVSTSSIFNPDSTAIYDSLLPSQHTDTLGLGRYYWKARAYDTRLQTWSSQTWTFLSAIRGDANGDKKVTVADVVYLVNFLFKNGPAPNPFQVGDVNCDGYVTVSDVVYLINYLFKGGPPPGC